MRTFQYSDAKSHKFWSIDVQGKSFTVTFGKVGTAGQSQTKTFPSSEKARAEAEKLIQEKARKGYTETTPPAVRTERDALEAAVKANPHDLAAHAALADYLMERGDPRGEFMQVQLALEDESLPKARRTALKAREKALLKKHLVEWAGDWIHLPRVREESEDWRSAPKNWVPYRFTRGLLTGLEFGDLTYRVSHAIANAKTLGFVRELAVHGFAYEEDDWIDNYDPDADEVAEEEDPLPEIGGEYESQTMMLRWPLLRQVRVFKFGGEEPVEYTDHCPYSCHMTGTHVYDFVKQMPDIEELHVMAHVWHANKLFTLPMPNLRVLLVYHGRSYPLDRLARNPTLTNLRELYCHPHSLDADKPYIRLEHLRAVCKSKYLTALTHLQLRSADLGDAGVDEILRSGLLKRLKVLDLRHGRVTDEGARALAASPDLKNLDRLDLAWNQIGKAGQAALRKSGVNVQLFHQLGADANEWEFFAYGDIE